MTDDRKNVKAVVSNFAGQSLQRAVSEQHHTHPNLFRWNFDVLPSCAVDGLKVVNSINVIKLRMIMLAATLLKYKPGTDHIM